jgi:hypothetical protein
MSDKMFSFVAEKNNITLDDAKYVLQQSEKLMPILLIQYKTDLNMICMKTKEYQRLLIQECKNKKK